MMIMKVFTTHLDQNLMLKIINIKKQQKSKIDTKLPNVSDYLESLSQEAKDLMNEIKDSNDDINIHMLAFIGSNKNNF